MRSFSLRIASVLVLVVAACGGGARRPDGGTSTGDFPIVGPAEVGELSSVTLTAELEGVLAPPYTLTWSRLEGPDVALDGAMGDTLTFRAPKVTTRATLVIEAVAHRDDAELARAQITFDAVERDGIVYVDFEEHRSEDDDERAAAPRLMRLHAEDASPVVLDEIALSEGAYIYQPRVSPDRRWVAYEKQTRVGDAFIQRAYIASIDGARVVDLLAGEENVSSAYVLWAADASGVYVLADDHRVRFVPVPTSSAQPPVAVLGEAAWNQSEVAPVGAHIVFSSDDGLFLAGKSGAAVRISPEDDGPGYFNEWRWSPDGTHVAYTMDPGDGRLALYVASVDTGSYRTVSGALSDVSDLEVEVEDFAWAADGQRLAFVGATAVDAFEAFVVDIRDTDPGAERRNVSGPGSADFTPWLSHLAFSPDGTKLAFSGRLASLSSELYVVDALVADPSSTRRTLSGAIVSGGHVSQQPGSINRPFAWSPDGDRLVFSGDLRVVGDHELFEARADGDSARRAIFDYDSDEYCSVHLEEDIAFDASGTNLLTNCVTADAEARHLWTIGLDVDPVVPMNTSTDAVFVASFGFALVPGSDTLVFAGSTASSDGRDALYRTTVGASSAPTALTPIAPDATVLSFVLFGPNGVVARDFD